MSLIIPTYEESKANDTERMDIINNIMAIQSTENLHILAVMSKQLYGDEIRDLPLTIDEFVGLLEFPILIKMMDIFKNESSEYFANRQVKELLEKAIDMYSGVKEEEIA